MMLKILILITTFSTFALAGNMPQVGYLYPSGGQRGTTFRIIAGGQKLHQPTGVYVTGKGISAKIIGSYRLRRNLNREQRILFQNKMEEVRDRRIAELPEKFRNRIHIQKNERQKRKNEQYMMMMREKAKDNPELQKKLFAQEKIPDHPLLHNLEEKNLRELANIVENFTNRKWRRQWNQQLAQLVEIEIKVDENAELGNREFRLKTQHGLSNPMVFQISNISEKKELEPNNFSANQKLPQLNKLPEKFLDQTVDLPVILNGQIMPGDVDRFRFRARKGEKIVIETFARQLVPYLADTVPGWFQSVITLYDSKRKKLAFDDDYRFNPDPVLYYKIPKTGEYEIEIRDAIYRGRSDFIYRIKISEEPFVTKVFPLGGQTGTTVRAKISGYNLPETNIIFDTKSGDKIIRATFLQSKNYKSNPITYAVNNLPECFEEEDNDSTNQAQKIDFPKIINGKIDKAGDIDIFKIHGTAGEKIVVEVYARQLNSPLNSLLKIIDKNGKILKWNDDYIVKDKFLHESTTGLITHHADSYLTTKLPETGTYYIQISDALNHGGKAYAYRLRISNPQPDFILFSSPSTINIFPGATTSFTVYAIRKEGFKGPIRIFTKDENLWVAGCVIPANANKIRMTITSKQSNTNQVKQVELFAIGQYGECKIIHKVRPVDNTMQAFLYRQLVPSEKLILFNKGIKWRIPIPLITNTIPVKIKSGNDVSLFFRINIKPELLKKIKIELENPPKGISITNINTKANIMDIQLHTKELNPGYKDNLIFSISREPFKKNKKGKSKNWMFKMDTFPAVPIEVVK